MASLVHTRSKEAYMINLAEGRIGKRGQIKKKTWSNPIPPQKKVVKPNPPTKKGGQTGTKTTPFSTFRPTFNDLCICFRKRSLTTHLAIVGRFGEVRFNGQSNVLLRPPFCKKTKTMLVMVIVCCVGVFSCP